MKKWLIPLSLLIGVFWLLTRRESKTEAQAQEPSKEWVLGSRLGIPGYGIVEILSIHPITRVYAVMVITSEAPGNPIVGSVVNWTEQALKGAGTSLV